MKNTLLTNENTLETSIFLGSQGNGGGSDNGTDTGGTGGNGGGEGGGGK